MVKLSRTSKLDGVRSWSLQARATCPGSKENGKLVPACAGCYAIGGKYRFQNVRAPREHNRKDWCRPAWTDDMVRELANDRFFRWFDSGDVYHANLARKILEVVKRTPWCQHWIPTRSHKFAKINRVLQAINRRPNAVVRPSADSIDGTFTPGVHGSCIIPAIEALLAGALLCHAAINDGKCGHCRACYSKFAPVIAYVAHGRTMRKIIRISTLEGI